MKMDRLSRSSYLANPRSVFIVFWPFLNRSVSHLQADRGLIQKLASENTKAGRHFGANFWVLLSQVARDVAGAETLLGRCCLAYNSSIH